MTELWNFLPASMCFTEKMKVEKQQFILLSEACFSGCPECGEKQPEMMRTVLMNPGKTLPCTEELSGLRIRDTTIA